MSPGVALIIGLVLALAATIVMYVMVMPKKKDGQLSPFFQFVHNYFHFKQLYIEIVLKFTFALLTLTSIAGGFFMLFSSVNYGYYSRSFALNGLMLMVLGPIALRLVYEMSLMFVLMVQNVIDINKKIKGDGKPAADPFQPAEPVMRFCSNCGTQFDVSQSDVCPNCGTRQNLN